MALNEADNCRVYVPPPGMRDSGWETLRHSISEQYTFTDGRVRFTGNRTRRGEQKRADYLLRYTQDYPLAVLEAKLEGDHVAKGMQQAKDCAEILWLKFAHATNGKEIPEFDYLTGKEV